jgi:hypothetical protein
MSVLWMKSMRESIVTVFFHDPSDVPRVRNSVQIDPPMVTCP